MNGVANSMPNREVALIVEELSRAVELTLSPDITQEERLQAYNACESFKESSPWCAQAGLLLASGAQHSPVVKHFGLQLMENTVKFRWIRITQTEKLFIKENAMKLLYLGGWEAGHLNDALARVIVEMIKREWPQQWPTLLVELSDACNAGHLQTEIVLHVFLRLVEDIATLQTFGHIQRRRDIYQALTSNMGEIFSFFMRLIELHVQGFREKTTAGDFTAANSHGRVVQVVLQTLTGFVEWVQSQHIVTNNGRLLHILCILLQDESFQIPALDCLLHICNRKGAIKDRKALLMLFSEDAITCIYHAIVAANNIIDEKRYLILKKLSQLLASLAQQLVFLWPFVMQQEIWMPLLVESVLLLMSHPSLTIAHTTALICLALFKHEQISKHPQVVAAVPRWLQVSAPKVLKVAYPATRAAGGHDVISYACLDYDSEQEFAAFFIRCRAEILDTYRYSMTIAPLVTWSFVEQWTQSALDKVSSCPAEISAQHPLYIEWEALSMVLDVSLSRLLIAEPRADVVQGLRLLQRCVSCNPLAPPMLSYLLSFISALFVFLSCASCQLAGPGVGSAGVELLPRVLDKIFASLVYEADTPENYGSRTVKNVRRHASGLLVKLALKYPLLLLPVFNRMHSSANAVLSRPELSALCSVTLQEALLIVSNHFCSYERQSALVAEVLGDGPSRWVALSPHLSSAAGLCALIGLSSDPVIAENEHADARRTLIHAVALVLGIVKRTQVPDDPDKATRGGFGAGTTLAGNPLWRNPCAVHVLPLLPHILALTRTLHDLHLPASKSLIHPGYTNIFRLSVAEQQNLLGLRDVGDCTATTPVDKMQNYLHTLHENCCLIIGAAATTIGRELYAVGGLARALQSTLLHGLAHLPDHWLRTVVRTSVKSLIHHCSPKHFADVAIPVIECLTHFLLQHLTSRWEYITSLYESGKLEETGNIDNNTQEVLEDILLRVLTKECLELYKIALVGGPLGESGGTDMDEDGAHNTPTSSSRTPENLSELGTMMMEVPTLGATIFRMIFVSMTWPDSTCSMRACALACPVLRVWAASGKGSAGEAGAALSAVLYALRIHGQHDANQAGLLALAVLTYEILRPQFPTITNILRSIPDVDARDLIKLDEKSAVQTTKNNKIDKAKRELFKKITTPLIGRSVGQLFKKEVFIMDLPSMPAKEKPKGPPSPQSVGLEQLFASNAPT